ncbi:MAG TPA: hypothetical protein VHC94_17570 [Nitrobacter sp.]|nr:hypothetical protein [Nitrobacter sp.]
MCNLIRSLPAALATVCLAVSFHIASGQDALAQTKPAPAQAAPADVPPLKQIPLTEKQVQSVLAAQNDMDALTEKLPDDPDARPDPKAMAQLDGVAKKYGFADYAEYATVIDNITLVLGGFDPQTKTYIGAEAVLKKQIAAVEADNKMPSKEKKQALDDMVAALKTPAPAIENKGNIDLVAKYYDKLADLFSDNGDD